MSSPFIDDLSVYESVDKYMEHKLAFNQQVNEYAVKMNEVEQDEHRALDDIEKIQFHEQFHILIWPKGFKLLRESQEATALYHADKKFSDWRKLYPDASHNDIDLHYHAMKKKQQEIHETMVKENHQEFKEYYKQMIAKGHWNYLSLLNDKEFKRLCSFLQPVDVRQFINAGSFSRNRCVKWEGPINIHHKPLFTRMDENKKRKSVHPAKLLFHYHVAMPESRPLCSTDRTMNIFNTCGCKMCVNPNHNEYRKRKRKHCSLK